MQSELTLVADGFAGINQQIASASGTFNQIEQASNELNQTSIALAQSVDSISHTLGNITAKGTSVAGQAIGLSEETESIYRTGSRCGSHTETMLLQTYKRDTGEILHDLSVPIYVDGRHWGGFRIGFKRAE